jgi:hypothetical protein
LATRKCRVRHSAHKTNSKQGEQDYRKLFHVSDFPLLTYRGQ